jgi:hypothetical protein
MSMVGEERENVLQKYNKLPGSHGRTVRNVCVNGKQGGKKAMGKEKILHRLKMEK